MLKYLRNSGMLWCILKHTCFRMHHVLMTAADIREMEGEAACIKASTG